MGEPDSGSTAIAYQSQLFSVNQDVIAAAHDRKLQKPSLEATQLPSNTEASDQWEK